MIQIHRMRTPRVTGQRLADVVKQAANQCKIALNGVEANLCRGDLRHSKAVRRQAARKGVVTLLAGWDAEEAAGKPEIGKGIVAERLQGRGW